MISYFECPAVGQGEPPSDPESGAARAGLSPQEKAAEVRATFAGYAEKLGLDVERFKKDMDSEPVRARIRSDQERAASVGVDRTPSLIHERHYDPL